MQRYTKDMNLWLILAETVHMGISGLQATYITTKPEEMYPGEVGYRLLFSVSGTSV